MGQLETRIWRLETRTRQFETRTWQLETRNSMKRTPQYIGGQKKFQPAAGFRPCNCMENVSPQTEKPNSAYAPLPMIFIQCDVCDVKVNCIGKRKIEKHF